VIPATFDYVRPATLADALAAVADRAVVSRPIAGGQSLLPLMKLRLARPERLVDIGRLEELRGVRALDDGRLAIGALATWSELLEDARVSGLAALGDTIPTIGDVAVRNRGTLGGSIAHADPAADIAASLLALDAEIVVRSASRTRSIPATEVYVGPFVTTLQPDELVAQIRLPAGPMSRGLQAFGSAYAAVAHPASGYPIAGVAAVLGRRRRGRGPWDACAIGVTGVGERPFRATAVELAVLEGGDVGAALAMIADGQRTLSDPYADREYRMAMAAVVTRRALERAARRADAPPAGRSVSRG
jgi:carbon-monoxide dehydrogenase medium subunit